MICSHCAVYLYNLFFVMRLRKTEKERWGQSKRCFLFAQFENKDKNKDGRVVFWSLLEPICYIILTTRQKCLPAKKTRYMKKQGWRERQRDRNRGEGEREKNKRKIIIIIIATYNALRAGLCCLCDWNSLQLQHPNHVNSIINDEQIKRTNEINCK